MTCVESFVRSDWFWLLKRKKTKICQGKFLCRGSSSVWWEFILRDFASVQDASWINVSIVVKPSKEEKTIDFKKLIKILKSSLIWLLWIFGCFMLIRMRCSEGYACLSNVTEMLRPLLVLENMSCAWVSFIIAEFFTLTLFFELFLAKLRKMFMFKVLFQDDETI